MRTFLLLSLSTALFAHTPQAPDELLKVGFDNMYNLAFPAAHRSFEDWQKLHPTDPRGPVFDAAAYLFSEFDRLRILQSEFFLDDDNFFSHQPRLVPDPQVRRNFDTALSRAKQLADSIMAKSPNDENALFASVLRLGLQADYTALIDKRNFAALAQVKEARQTAQKLLALYPDCYDAHLANGVENYLLSQKPAPVRWLLHFGGAQTDKDAGVADLKIVADKGQYLQPYAQLLLAVAALRDNDDAGARRLLSDLARRFGRNPLYREELAKIGG